MAPLCNFQIRKYLLALELLNNIVNRQFTKDKKYSLIHVQKARIIEHSWALENFINEMGAALIKSKKI